jgi:hypothetical protein
MSEEKFQDAAALEAWLVNTKGVDKDDIADAATKLFLKGFNKPSTLIGISSAELREYEIPIPRAKHLSNKLAKDQQQQNGKFRCCSRILYCIQCVVRIREYSTGQGAH